MVCRGKGRPILFPSKNYTAWHKEQIDPLRDAKDQQGIDIPLSTVRLVTVHFTASTRHKWDLSNKLESIMDILVDVGVLEDDNYEVVPEIHIKYDGYDKERGHYCKVEIT